MMVQIVNHNVGSIPGTRHV